MLHPLYVNNNNIKTHFKIVLWYIRMQHSAFKICYGYVTIVGSLYAHYLFYLEKDMAYFC